MSDAFQVVSWLAVSLGLLSCFVIVIDLPRRQAQPVLSRLRLAYLFAASGAPFISTTMPSKGLSPVF